MQIFYYTQQDERIWSKTEYESLPADRKGKTDFCFVKKSLADELAICLNDIEQGGCCHFCYDCPSCKAHRTLTRYREAIKEQSE